MLFGRLFRIGQHDPEERSPAEQHKPAAKADDIARQANLADAVRAAGEKQKSVDVRLGELFGVFLVLKSQGVVEQGCRHQNVLLADDGVHRRPERGQAGHLLFEAHQQLLSQGGFALHRLFAGQGPGLSRPSGAACGAQSEHEKKRHPAARWSHGVLVHGTVLSN